MKEMIKKYRGSLISSILVIFVGVLVGLVLRVHTVNG